MVVIGKNGNVSFPDGWTNGTILLNSRMTEGSSSGWRDATTNLTAYISVYRHEDNNSRKIYSITLDDRAPS
jgi:hypothetical protein